MDLQINSKTLYFQVKNNADRQVIDSIIQTGQNPLSCCENLICVGDDVLLYNRRKKMALRHGMETLKITLQLIEKPVRIKPDRALPGCFFLDNYLGVESIEDANIVKLQGDITRCELQELIVAAKTKAPNNSKVKKVLEKSTAQYVRVGDIPILTNEDIENITLRKRDPSQMCTVSFYNDLVQAKLRVNNFNVEYYKRIK
jgi:hypothetical protein